MKTAFSFAFYSASLAMLFCFATAAQADVIFDLAHIGNAGNAADTTGYGAVGYNYSISKTEVSNVEYTQFLNAVAATDNYDLYNASMGSTTHGGIVRSGSSGSFTYAVKADAVGGGPGGASDYTYGNKPVVYVSWYDSVRFTNWLHNSQGSGDTETGAYTLLGGTAIPSNGLIVTRNADAKFWLPSEDEWYKAAYHDASAGTAGTYFDFATGTDTAPDNSLPTADSGNSANFFDNGVYTNGNLARPLTDVGAYALSGSPYGTFDQSGNVLEWNETLVRSSARGLRGGSWISFSDLLPASNRFSLNPSREDFDIGFRVASVPEPSSLLLVSFALGGMFARRKRLS